MWETVYDLTIFGGDGGATGADGQGAGGAHAGGEPGADGQSAGGAPGSAVERQAEDAARSAAFEEMLAANKDLYEAKVKQQLDRRMRGARQESDQLRGSLSRYEQLAQALGTRYGVDPGNLEALEQAVNSDQSWLEEQAARNGLTVEQQKHQNALEAENRRYKAAREAAERQAQRDSTLARWQAEAEQLKQVYPNFDIDQEAHNETFADLLGKGVNMRLAYEVAHHDELMSGAMEYAVQRTANRVADSVRANGLMPVEGAGKGNAPVGIGTDPSKLTKAQCEDLERRAMRGERITFG